MSAARCLRPRSPAARSSFWSVSTATHLVATLIVVSLLCQLCACCDEVCARKKHRLNTQSKSLAVHTSDVARAVVAPMSRRKNNSWSTFVCNCWWMVRAWSKLQGNTRQSTAPCQEFVPETRKYQAKHSRSAEEHHTKLHDGCCHVRSRKFEEAPLVSVSLPMIQSQAPCPRQLVALVLCTSRLPLPLSPLPQPPLKKTSVCVWCNVILPDNGVSYCADADASVRGSGSGNRRTQGKAHQRLMTRWSDLSIRP